MNTNNTTQELSKIEKKRLANRLSYQRNKEKRKKACLDHYYKKREKCVEVTRQYYKNNKEKHIKKVRDWQISNRNRICRNKRLRYNTDIYYKMLANTRVRIWAALKLQVATKKTSTLMLLGCTLAELKEHLEKQFKPGMNWNNYSFYGWHIDHIKPCSSFDLTDDNQLKECFHYTNLQPLWARDNWSKSDKL